MTSKLERAWWFSLPVTALSVLLTLRLLDWAGMETPESWAQWMVYFFCMAGFQRALSLLGWLMVLLLAPKSKVLN